MESLAEVIRQQASLRARGLATLQVVSESDRDRIRLAYLTLGLDPEQAPPSTHVFCDDFMDFAPSFEACEELVELTAAVFEAANLPEKTTKRAGPAQCLPLLGFLFDTTTGIVKIPEPKRQEILSLLRSILRRAKQSQSVSAQELISMIGKLTWAATGIEAGRVYLRHVRKPVTSVQDLLPSRSQRERFAIPLFMFPQAVAELEWWMEALTLNADGHKWNVGASGLFEAWKWHGVAGELIPDGALQFATDASKKGGGI
eukprot:3846670-Rhodomonas_salina.1